MLDDIKVKECERISKLIVDLEEQKEQVEEKYRKLAESETAAITATIEAYQEMQKFWESMDGETPVKPKRKRRTKAEMEAARLAETELPDDEKVVDTLEEEQSEPEFDGAGFTSEDNVASQQELDSQNEHAVEWPEPIDNEVTPEPAEVTEWPEHAVDPEIAGEAEANLDDDIWPDFPNDMK